MTLAVIAASVLAWQAGWFAGEPEPPPHPLTLIEADDIVSVDILAASGPQPLAGEPLRRAATAIAALKHMKAIDSRAVVWGSATLLRAVTRDGVTLSLQVKPLAGGAAVRVTADAAPDCAATAGAEAAAIRTLRLNAYRVGPDLAAALLRPGEPAATAKP